MMTRCQNKKHKTYAHYGGRGVTVCDRWQIFTNFMEDMYSSYKEHVAGHSENETTLDRIDGKLGYFKENCRWATHAEQTQNTSSILKVRIGKETKNLTEWCRILGVNKSSVHGRIKTMGLTPLESLLYRPINPRKRKDGQPTPESYQPLADLLGLSE